MPSEALTPVSYTHLRIGHNAKEQVHEHAKTRDNEPGRLNARHSSPEPVSYTHLDVKDELDKYADKFDKISLSDPLLTSDDDYKKVAAAIKENMAVSYTHLLVRTCAASC